MRLFLIFMMSLFIGGCVAQTPPTLSQDQQAKQSETSELKEVSYKRQARGGGSLMTVTSKKIVLSYANRKSQTFSYPKADWDSIQYFVSKLNVSSLPTIEAPTAHRTYDGAAAANLTVVIKQKSWVSSTFDDGYPPKEIANLVNKLMSLEESLLKE